MSGGFHASARGPSVRLSADNMTACRLQPRAGYNGGMVFASEPIRLGEMFTVQIDRIVSVWCGSIEVGLVQADPLVACQFPSASSIELPCWVLSGEYIYVNSQRHPATLTSGRTLDDLQPDDTLGLKFVRDGDKANMQIYINGDFEGICARGIPADVATWAVIDMYGTCQQISVVPAAAQFDSAENEETLLLPAVISNSETSDSQRYALVYYNCSYLLCLVMGATTEV